MGIFLGWIIFSFVVGFVGSNRKIGFLGAFLLSLLLSPLIGLIIALVSKNKADEAYKAQLLSVQQNQQDALRKLSEQKNQADQKISLTEELEKLKKLREDNLITDEEFQSIKSKIINS